MWSEEDRLRPFTALGLLGVGAAGVLAVVGIPDLPLMWPLYRLGIVLPGCGLTRGTVALAEGDLAGAWRWNPASYLVAAAGATLVVRAVAGHLTGRWAHLRVTWRRWHLAAAGLATALLWVNQWRQAELLMGA